MGTTTVTLPRELVEEALSELTEWHSYPNCDDRPVPCDGCGLCEPNGTIARLRAALDTGELVDGNTVATLRAGLDERVARCVELQAALSAAETRIKELETHLALMMKCLSEGRNPNEICESCIHDAKALLEKRRST